MTIQRLERVMWRIRKRYPQKARLTNENLEYCILLECGTDPKTVRVNRMNLIKLGWLEISKEGDIILTNKDISGDY